MCAYDRAGMGWSERGPTPRDLKQHVGELRALLSAAGVEAPYVLVGNSYGARVALVYAKDYPGDVAGMALIDPGKLDDDPRFPPENRSDLAAEERTIGLARWLAPFGVVRLFCRMPITAICPWITGRRSTRSTSRRSSSELSVISTRFYRKPTHNSEK